MSSKCIFIRVFEDTRLDFAGRGVRGGIRGTHQATPSQRLLGFEHRTCPFLSAAEGLESFPFGLQNGSDTDTNGSGLTGCRCILLPRSQFDGFPNLLNASAKILGKLVFACRHSTSSKSFSLIRSRDGNGCHDI